MIGPSTAGTPRPRVTALLRSLAERRLVCVLGDAASGKSTAVRHWAEGHADPVCAVSVTPARDGPRHLLGALVAATAAHCPGLVDALGPELDAHATSAHADDPVELAAVLAGALAAAWGEQASAQFTVVLDDFDEIRDPAGVAFVGDLIRLYPRTVRMLVLARTAPPFALHRLQAAGEYGELGPRALRFDAGETAALFATAGVTLDPATARAVTDACGGWAGGLRLALESALSFGVTDLVTRLASSGAPRYLAAVALDPLDPATRSTVRTLALLGHVERAVTAHRPDATARLDALADRGLLVDGDTGGWTLTALARYAVEMTDPGRGSVTMGDADPEVAATVAECVAMAAEAGRAEPAVRWAARHGSRHLVLGTLADVGWQLLDVADPVLAEAADRLPVPAGDVAVDGLLASYFASRGDIRRALQHLGGVGDGADAAGRAPLSAQIAWRVANALWMHGDAADAQAVVDRAQADGTRVDRAQLAATRATLAWGRGDGAAARAHADEALDLARDSDSESALGVAWVAQALVAALEGDLLRNQRCYSTALTHALAAHDVLTQLRIRCNVGSRLTETGQYRAAVVELDEALRLGEATGQRTRIALARLNQGQARLGLGRLDLALQDIDAALAIWTELESPMAAYAHQTRGEALARRGDPTRAIRALRSALAAAEIQRDAQTLAPSTAWLARCLVADDPEQAAALAERALAEPAALGSVSALLAGGWIALLAGDRTVASGRARAARDEAARRDDPSSLAQALVMEVLAGPAPEAGDARLGEARALIEEVGDEMALAEIDVVDASLRGDRAGEERGRARLRALGVRDSATLVAGPLAALHDRRRSAVTIRTLGSFGVQLGDIPVPSSAWQSRKARDLVKILAARRGKAITRGALADLLWPDGTGDAAGNRLSVALSTARAVFDPHKAMPADHVLMADRDAVRLNPRTVTVDLEDYVALADAALTAAAAGAADALPALERAAAAYGGDFCEEDPYEAWAAQTRDELRARQQQVLRALAGTLARAGRPGAAVPWLIALIGLDGYDEQSHLRLIATLVRAGRHGEARRAYRAYSEAMADIDVEPAAFPQQARRSAAPDFTIPEGAGGTVSA